MISGELLCIAVLNLGMPNAEYACTQMQHIMNAAEDLNFQPELLVSLIHHESRWVPTARSRSGACGLTQVLPRYTRPRKSCRQLFFAPTSIYEGAKALRRWTDGFGRGNLARGLCGYNAGYGCRTRATRGWRYSRKIQRMVRRIRREVDKIEEDGC